MVMRAIVMVLVMVLVRDKLSGLICLSCFEYFLFVFHHLGWEYLLLVRLQVLQSVMLPCKFYLSLLLEIIVGLFVLLYCSQILVYAQLNKLLVALELLFVEFCQDFFFLFFLKVLHCIPN